MKDLVLLQQVLRGGRRNGSPSDSVERPCLRWSPSPGRPSFGSQVARQLAVIEGKAQHEAITEERQRIAREFHDTLEQELAGLSVAPRCRSHARHR